MPPRHVLRGDAHAHNTIPRILARTFPEPIPELRGNRAAPVVPRHALHAAGDSRLDLAGEDRGGDGADGRKG